MIALIGPRVLEVRPAAEIREVALRVERDLALGGVDELDLVVLALARRRGALPRPRRSPGAPTPGPPSARAGSRPRCSPAPPRRSARGTRSRSRSRSRSAGRSRSSSRDRAGGRPRPGDARPSGAARRARQGRPCRASSGSGSARRPRAARANPGHCPFERTRTASLASFGPIAAAASSPVAPSGSSSSEESGRTTFMEDQNMPREDDRNEEIPESPAPDPEEGDRPGAEDDPGPTETADCRQQRQLGGRRLAPAVRPRKGRSESRLAPPSGYSAEPTARSGPGPRTPREGSAEPKRAQCECTPGTILSSLDNRRTAPGPEESISIGRG